MKCTNKSFNQYILKCRPFIHDDFVNDKFLIPIDNFLGNEKLRRCSFENHEFIPKNIEKDRVISIGYSDFEPNKKIAESVAQSLNYLFGIKSRLVKFSNLISFIRKNEIVDVSVNVTYPTVDHEFSIFTNALFDYDEQVRREIINLLLKKNIKKLSYMSSFSNTMVPLFTSNFIYLTRLKNLEVDYFGKIVLKEKFYGN